MINDKLIDEAVKKLMEEHNLAVENLTKKQVAKCIKEMIKSGDFVRHVTMDNKQEVSYEPFREANRIKKLYYELLYAVSAKVDGETRHETALRNIEQAESKYSLSQCLVEKG